MNKAILCLGTNLGNRSGNLEKCIGLINDGCGKVVNKSKIYETEAWGSKSKNKFLNCVIRIETEFKAVQLLSRLLKIEENLGRKRNGEKNSDRIIDIDILFFNKEIIKGKDIEIPHPRLHLRNFVLKPLMDIQKKLVHPVLKKSVKQLYQECTDKLAVKEFKPVKYICIEGNIGSGKTTLARELSGKMGAIFLGEQFEKNDLLSLVYSQPHSYAFPLEYSFLLERYSQIKNAFKDKEAVIVSDYSFYKSLWFAELNLNKKDFSYFKKHFNILSKNVPEPDLIVHLSTSVKNLKKNILKRGRKFEEKITENYLISVEKKYDKGIKKTGKRILKIHVKKYDHTLNTKLIREITNNIN